MEQEITRYTVNTLVIPLYIDSAKTYMQLSAGALALSIAFKEKVLGQISGLKVGILMLSSWLMFLLAIGASALYQYVAVKLLDSLSPYPGAVWGLKTLVDSPGKAYGVMLFAFYLGAILLVLSATKQLFDR